MTRHCVICEKVLISTNHSNYCGIHHKDSSIAIVLQDGEIAVQKAKIEEIIKVLDDHQYTDIHDSQNADKAINMLMELLK